MLESQGGHSPQRPRPSGSPKRPLPKRACDSHIHVSDGTGRFAIQRQTHAPLHALEDERRAMLQATGLERCVAVQLMAYGNDNAALLEALRLNPQTLRGIAEVDASVTDQQLQDLHTAGVRGLRFYFCPPKPIPNLDVKGVGMKDLAALAPRVRELGWCAEISADCDFIVANAPALVAAGIPIVLEHMGGCTAVRGIEDAAVRALISLVRNEPFWVKLSICAMSERFPDYEDLRPVHDAFVDAAPERTVWGSNWPHAMPAGKAPDSGHLLDLFDAWVDDTGLRRAILCDNPVQLFGFDP